jgi:steroid delta-isomerase-like uncharacterized protein
MSTEMNKALVRRYFEEFLNQGNLSVADDIFEANVVFRGPLIAVDGVDRLKRFYLMIRKLFPDLHYVAEEGIAEGDKVVSCFSSRGTCLGDFQGTQLHGKRFSIMGVDVFRIRDGKITDVRSFFDTYDQMQQLGFIPLTNACL